MLKRTALTGLGLVLLASPLLVSAQSISDLQAQVNALLAQLQALQQQQNQNQTLSPLPSPSPVPPYQPGDYDPEENSACVALQYNLKYRMTDARTEGEVSLLQDFLQAEGYLSSQPTGFFGLQTLAAAKKYQANVGLSPTGYVGPLTREKIKDATCDGGGGGGGPGVGGIKVTAPNGGERWEIGQLNTITWGPYSYNPNVNPANEVSVYLDRNHGGNLFTTAGRIMDTGKASLHTYFNLDNYETWAQPGEYYVRVVNNSTGASDRSDRPFTLLPKPVDLKVNGSDGPLTLAYNQKITLSWTSSGMRGCTTVSGVRAAETPQLTSEGLLPPQGTLQAWSDGSSITFGCQKLGSQTGLYVYDYVNVNPAPTIASLKVTSPNGGEKFDPNKEMVIQLSSTALQSAAVALYKNDQWKYWIDKDVQSSAKDLDRVTVLWTPSAALAGLGEGDNAGAIFKIYVTGQRADGQGYVEDKSDAPFEFSGASDQTTGTLRMQFKDASLPEVPNVIKRVAASICGLGNTVICTWNFQNIQPSPLYGKEGDPRITFVNPVGGQNQIIDVASPSHTIILSDSSLGSNDGILGMYRIYLVKYNEYGVAENVYEAQILSAERSSNSVYLKWNLQVMQGSEKVAIMRVPVGNYYFFAVNTVTGTTGTVSAYTYLQELGPANTIQILYPTAGTILQQGQATTISWLSIGPNAQYVIGYTAGGKGDLGTYSATQANCSASSKCYISWTPQFSYPDVSVTVQEVTTGRYGDSGSFSIAQSTPTPIPTLTFTASPISISSGQSSTLSWSSTGATSCTASGDTMAFYGTRETSGSNSTGSLSTSKTYSLTCTGLGGSVTKSVLVMVGTQPTETASVRVVTPNGGEQISQDQPYLVKWSGKDIKSVTIAIYKNDQLHKLIVRDMNSPSGAFESDQIQLWSEWRDEPIGQNVYKIHVSGQRADGQGSVEDTSDAPFGFTARPTATFTINGKTSDTVSVGDTYRYEWSSKNADTFSSNYSASCVSGATWSDAWAADNAQGSASGTISPDAAGCTYTVNYIAKQSSTGSDATSQVTVTVRPMTTAESTLYSNLAGAWTSFMFGGKDTTSVAQTSAVGAKTNFTYRFTLDLWRGQEGTEVRALQEALTALGLYDGEITGGFFDRTLAAVIAFQTKYGINPTGYVGPATRAQLNALFSL